MAINAISGLTLNFRNTVDGAEKASAKDMLRLSTGLRINSAADDAAGLAISTRMNAQSRGMAMAIRNANDFLSFTQTAEGGAKEINSVLQRMRELSVQASTGTLNDIDRGYINEEIEQLKQHINSVTQQTKFNGMNLLDGSVKDVNFQIGGNINDTMKLSLDALDTSTLGQTPIQNKYELTFTGLAAGQSVTIAGLTFKATVNTSAADVATAFANLSESATTGGGSANGTYTGVFKGFSSGSSTSNSLILETAPTNLIGEAPEISVNQIENPPTVNSYNISFPALISGQSITIAGLSYTASADANSSTVAAAFANLSEGATRGSGNGSYSGTFNGFTSTSDSNASVTLISTLANLQGNPPAITSLGGSAPTTPLVQTTQGTPGVTAVAGARYEALYFIPIQGNAGFPNAGDSLTLNGLKVSFTQNMLFSGAQNMYQALSGITEGSTTSGNGGASGVTYSGVFLGDYIVSGGWNSAVGTAYDTLGYGVWINVGARNFVTGTPPIDIQVNIAGAGALNKYQEQQGQTPVQGVPPTTECSIVDFSNLHLKKGESLTIDGYKFTATNNVPTNELMYVFYQASNNIAYSSSYGVSSGSFSNFSSSGGGGLNDKLIFNSTTSNTNVVDIQITTEGVLPPSLPTSTLASSSTPLLAEKPASTLQPKISREVPHCLKEITVATATGASDAISVIDESIKNVSAAESYLGAIQNRLQSAINNLTTANTNLKASLSRIEDADYAVETSNMAKHQIISQAAMAMLAQANQSTGAVESLLKQFK